jgi:hypothetical protein
MRSAIRAVTVTGLPGLLLLTVGCSSAPSRYDVSGKVTFNGRAVPAGVLRFDPDAAAGNNGPQGFVEFRDGVYDTSKGGRGTGGGPYIVYIQGFDGQRAPDLPLGRPLFPEHQTRIDLSRENTVHDFDVPPVD